MQKTIARKDVIMRLEMPRFLTEGDTVTISGVVHNFLKSDKSTKISLESERRAVARFACVRRSRFARTASIASIGACRRITVGKLTLLAKALTDTESDAVEMTMEIVPHGLKQTTRQHDDADAKRGGSNFQSRSAGTCR